MSFPHEVLLLAPPAPPAKKIVYFINSEIANDYSYFLLDGL